MDWLNQYRFPTELKFKDREYPGQGAAIFIDELLRNETTTAVVLTAVFSAAVDAFFEVASRRNLRMIAGKVMMERNAPNYLTDTAQ